MLGVGAEVLRRLGAIVERKTLWMAPRPSSTAMYTMAFTLTIPDAAPTIPRFLIKLSC